MRRLFLGIGCVFMFAMVITPVTHNAFKLVPLAILVLGIVVSQAARGGRLHLHRTVFLWFMFYIGIGAVFVFEGFVLNAPGTPYVAVTYVAYPVVYLLLVEACHDLRVLRPLIAAAVIGGMFTSAYMLDYLLWALHIVPSSFFFKLDEGQLIALSGLWVGMHLYAISGLVFLVPFVVAALIVFPQSRALPLKRGWFWAALGLGLIGALLSGRKALILTVAASPILLAVLLRALPAELRAQSAANSRRFLLAVGAVIVIAGVSLSATGLWDWSGLALHLSSGFDVQHDGGANVRLQQMGALVDGWWAHPVFGWGWGQGAPGITRNNERAWEYELQYFLTLFSTGIVGSLLYSSGIVWVYVTGLRMIRSGTEHSLYMIPLLLGMTSILLANGSNPYLESGGNMWMVFLPVAMINSWLLRRDGAPAAINPQPLSATYSRKLLAFRSARRENARPNA